MMPSRRLTPGGSSPPSCRYLCTASRPVNTTPLMATSSPTLSARILSSVKGRERGIIAGFGKLSRSIQPLRDLAIAIQFDATPAVGPAHVAHADEIRRRHAVRRADLHAQQRGLAAETHRADAEFVGRLEDVLLQRVELRLGIAVVEQPEEL